MPQRFPDNMFCYKDESYSFKTKFLGILTGIGVEHKRDSRGRAKIWIKITCPDCGNVRMVRKEQLMQVRKSISCLGCSLASKDRSEKMRNISKPKYGKDSPNYKKGIFYHRGYAYTILPPSHKFISMAQTKRKILLHRLIMAEHLGRSLEKWEIVHHKNGVRSDNRIENLELINSAVNHHAITIAETEFKRLKDENEKLKNMLMFLLGYVSKVQITNYQTK